jgi:hypothetical protein
VVPQPLSRLIDIGQGEPTERRAGRIRRAARASPATIVRSRIGVGRARAASKEHGREGHREQYRQIGQTEQIDSPGGLALSRCGHAGKATALEGKLNAMAATETKLPRAVRKGPLITVTCECGQRRELRYGEQWLCDGCGRKFDTNKIPLEEYAAIRRTQLRYRMFPLIAGLLLLVGAIAFFLTGRAYGALVAVPFLLASWGIFGRPFYRSRYRRALTKNLPAWKIESD